MTKTQKAHAVRLLKNDCELKGQYINDSGLTCAIGCLALAAGVRKKTLEEVNYYGISESFEEYPALKRIVEAIERKFGLTKDQQHDIQAANDGQTYHDLRVDEVVEVVKRMRVRRSK